jgi:MFS family permease
MVSFMYVAERKRKVRGVLLLSIAILMLSLFGLALGGSLSWQWLVGIFCFFTAFNLLEATLPSWLSKQAPAGSKGTAMGVYSTCQFLGASAGGFAGGYVVQNFGVAEVFWLAGISCFVWLIVAIFMQAPPYLKSLCVPQKKPISGPALMTKVAGVVECAWVAEQQLLYLKVNDNFEQQALDEYLK